MQQQILIPFSPTKVQHLFGFCKHFGNFFFIAQMAKFSKTKRQHTEYMSFDTKKET